MSDLMTIYQPLATPNSKHDSTKSPLVLLEETCGKIGVDTGLKNSTMHAIDHSRNRAINHKQQQSLTNGDGRRSGHSDPQSPLGSTPDKSTNGHGGNSRPGSNAQPPSRPGSNASTGNQNGQQTTRKSSSDTNKSLSYKPYEDAKKDSNDNRTHHHNGKDRNSNISPSQRKQSGSPKMNGAVSATSITSAAAAMAARENAAAAKAVQMQQQQLLAHFQYQQYMAAIASFAGATPFLSQHHSAALAAAQQLPTTSPAHLHQHSHQQQQQQQQQMNASVPVAASTTTTSSSGSSVTSSQLGGSVSTAACPPGCVCPLHSARIAGSNHNANSAGVSNQAAAASHAHFAAMAAQYPNIPLSFYGYGSPYSNSLPLHSATQAQALNAAMAGATSVTPSSVKSEQTARSSPLHHSVPPPSSLSSSSSSSSSSSLSAQPNKHLAYPCNWPLSNGQPCNKRFSSTEELILHNRTHMDTQTAAVPAAMPTGYEHLYAVYDQMLTSNQAANLRRTAFDPINSGARYHPYGKPPHSSANVNQATNNYHAAAAAAAAAAALNPMLSPLATNPLAASAQFGAFSPFAALGSGFPAGMSPGSIPPIPSVNPLSLTSASGAGSAAAAAALYSNLYSHYAATNRIGAPLQQ